MRKISQIFVAFSEKLNFKYELGWEIQTKLMRPRHFSRKLKSTFSDQNLLSKGHNHEDDLLKFLWPSQKS